MKNSQVKISDINKTKDFLLKNIIFIIGSLVLLAGLLSVFFVMMKREE